MNSLIVPFDEAEQFQIGAELDKLFVFQDKPLSKEKKAILVSELSGCGIPAPAMVQGIRSLSKADNLHSIKLGSIIEESRKFVHAEEADKCDSCHSGYVLMRDEENREFSLACICPAGQQRAMTQRLATWNGQATQDRRGRTLFALGANAWKP